MGESKAILVEEHDTTIDGGSLDVLVEVIRERHLCFASVTLTDEPPDSLSLADARKIRDLADRTVKAMERQQSEETD